MEGINTAAPRLAQTFYANNGEWAPSCERPNQMRSADNNLPKAKMVASDLQEYGQANLEGASDPCDGGQAKIADADYNLQASSTMLASDPSVGQAQISLTCASDPQQEGQASTNAANNLQKQASDPVSVGQANHQSKGIYKVNLNLQWLTAFVAYK